MQLSTDIEINDQATPALADLQRRLTGEGLRELRRGIATGFRPLVQNHIRKAAKTRHTTAERLGAKPTNYLARTADTVESLPLGEDRIRLNLNGEIFKRTFGPVLVKPREKKMLAIPISKESYAKRAAGMGGLFFVRSKKGHLLLCRRDGKELKPLFLLKESVTLPQDRGLLPSDLDFQVDAEKSAVRFIRAMRRVRG